MNTPLWLPPGRCTAWAVAKSAKFHTCSPMTCGIRRANADYPLEPREHGVDVVVEKILSCLAAVLADSGVPPGAILGVGVGVPGVVEHGAETVLYGQTYGWDGVPLERLLRAGTDLPLYIDNGANTMGLAELWFGAGQGARHAVVCLIGSGVGASIIGNGVTERAGASSGTEWGHTTIMVGGRDCRCGSLGHLEAYVGAEAILDRYGQPLPGDDEETALAALVALADTSPEAAKVLDETALYLGAGLADLINLYSPDQIILGGWAGLLLGHHLLPAIRASAREHALAHPFAETTITVGRLDRTRSRAVPPPCPSRPSSTAPRCPPPGIRPRPKRSAPPAPARSANQGRAAGHTTAATAAAAVALTQDMLNEKPPDDGHRLNILTSRTPTSVSRCTGPARARTRARLAYPGLLELTRGPRLPQSQTPQKRRRPRPAQVRPRLAVSLRMGRGRRAELKQAR